MPAFEGEKVFAVHVRPKALHQAEIHNRRAMHSLEQLWIENFLELFHCSAQDVSVPAGVDAHVVARGVDPLDRCDGDAHCLPT